MRAARPEALAGSPWDAAILGMTTAPGALDVAAYEAAGLSWFLESLHPMRPFADLLARVEAGPPR
jgi:hypothetical protein